MSVDRRPRPRPDADSLPFWEGCARQELLGQRCGSCGTWRWPPRSHCPACHAADPVWEKLPGTGAVVGHVVVHRPFDPTFADEVPLAIVHVALDGTDGEMVLISNLVPGEWERVAVGARVRVRFQPLEGGLALPLFSLNENPEE